MNSIISLICKLFEKLSQALALFENSNLHTIRLREDKTVAMVFKLKNIQ